MALRRIGERPVFPIGLAPVAPPAGWLTEARDEVFDTLLAALDSGVTLVDAVGCPSGGAAPDLEPARIVAEALATWTGSESAKERVLLAGHLSLTPDDPDVLTPVRAVGDVLGRPIDLCLLHRAIRREDWSGSRPAVAELLASQEVAAVGFADVDAAALDRALGEFGGPRDGGIVAVQNAFTSGFAAESGVIARCAREGVAYLPRVPVAASGEAHEPDSPFESFTTIAEQRSVSVSQLTLAWLLGQGDVVVPVVACSHAATIEAAVHAADIELDAAAFGQLSAAIPENLAIFD